jgi:hypothetical protein
MEVVSPSVVKINNSTISKKLEAMKIVSIIFITAIDNFSQTVDVAGDVSIPDLVKELKL